MKKMLISILAMAAMVSCSSESDPIDEVNPTGDNKVEIKLNAGVVGVETKAPITEWASGVNVQFAVGNTTQSYDNDWFATISGTEGTINFKEDNTFAAIKKYYYDADENTSTFIRGFYPAATRTTTTVSYTIKTNGEDDIMVSDEKSGNKKTDIPKLTFSHLLTQLKFKVLTGEGFPSDYIIKSIVLKGTRKSASLNLVNGKLTFAPSADDANGITALTNGDVIISGTAVDAGNEIMVEPESASMTLDIVAGKSGNTINDRTYTGVTFKTKNKDGIDEQAKAGNAYTITLKFSDKEVVTTAALTDWITTGTGEGDVI